MNHRVLTGQPPVTTISSPAASNDSPISRIVWDGLHDGFSVDVPGARWRYAVLETPAGPFVADDGDIRSAGTAGHGLHVISHPSPATGRPAFRKSVGQGPAGLLDHLKWLVYADHAATSGFPGFDAIDGDELRCEAVVGGRTYGTAGHPFGAAVRNPFRDLRLASVAMVVADFETSLVLDFVLTNTRLYALYERFPAARTPERPYAAFTYAVPVGARHAHQEHALAIAYDRGAGAVRWLLDGREVFRIDQLGRRIGRGHMLLDHGGIEETIAPRQLAPGMGMFTMLDGVRSDGYGLARLSDLPDHYFVPHRGAPARFLDEVSRPESRLFGQGAELRVRRYVVTSRASGEQALPHP
jgi:hypothetical protein